MASYDSSLKSTALAPQEKRKENTKHQQIERICHICPHRNAKLLCLFNGLSDTEENTFILANTTQKK